MEKWQVELMTMICRKDGSVGSNANTVRSRDMEGYNGNDKKCPSFRAVMLYCQMSPRIDLDAAEQAVRIISRNVVNSINTIRSFAPFFLNGKDFKPMHSRSIMESPGSAIRTAREYYEKYSQSLEEYSHTLSQLFPMTNTYSSTQYPSKQDLCIVFHDDEGVGISPSAAKRVNALKGNWILLRVQKGLPVGISETPLFE